MAVSAVWEGYVENFKFADKSDAVKLELVSDGTAIGGHVTFGMSPPPPPPVADPKVGYPLSANGDPSKISNPYPGFRFTIRNVLFADSRLQFDVSSSELWSAWCKQQVPVLDTANAGGYYACLPNWGTMFGGPECALMDPMGQWVPVDCIRLQLCQPGGTCSCTAQGCSVPVESGMMHFDMKTEASKADGSVAGLGGTLNVHLTRR